MNVLNKIKNNKNIQSQPQTQPIPKNINPVSSVNLQGHNIFIKNSKDQCIDSIETKKPKRESRQQSQVLMKDFSMLKEQNSMNFSQSFEEGLVTFHVRKGYMVGKISIFQGFYANKVNVPAVISCKSEVLGPPQSISRLGLNKVLEVGQEQYFFQKQDLVKVKEKQGNLRR